MTTCLGGGCSFGLLYVRLSSRLSVCVCVLSFLYDFERVEVGFDFINS